MILPPNSFYYFSIFTIKISRSFDHIIIECPFKIFSI